MRRSALAVGLAVLAPVSAAAQPSCPASVDPPRVEFEFKPKSVVINTEKSTAELRGMAPSTLGHRTLGLYLAGFSGEVAVRYNTRRVGGDHACLWITRVRVNLTYKERDIYIGREFKSGGCEHAAVLGHERKHAAADDQIVAEHMPLLRASVTEAARSLGVVGPVRGAELEAAKSRLVDEVNDAFQGALARFNAARLRVQKGIDTREEYARMARQCHDGFGIEE